MEFIEINSKKIIFGIFAFSFLVFYIFYKSYGETGVAAEEEVMGHEGVQPVEAL